MDYKAKLQTNNLDLNEILDTINTLPEASGGSGGVTVPDICTVSFVVPNDISDTITGVLEYTAIEENTVAQRSWNIWGTGDQTMTAQCLVGSICCIYLSTSSYDCIINSLTITDANGIEDPSLVYFINPNSYECCFTLNGSCTITFNY